MEIPDTSLPFEYFTYVYDGKGNMVEKWQGDIELPSLLEEMSYDVFNRMKQHIYLAPADYDKNVFNFYNADGFVIIRVAHGYLFSEMRCIAEKILEDAL